MSSKHSKKKVKINFGRLALSLVLVFAVVFAVITLVKDTFPALAKSAGELMAKDGRSGENKKTEMPADPTAGMDEPLPLDDPAGSEEPGEPVQTEEPESPAEPQITKLRIRCAGDVMAHDSQLKSAKTSDGYSFYSWFEYVKPLLEDADVTMVNVETTFPGSDYHGYPTFRSPDQLCDAIADFHPEIAIFANNHMLDSNQSGFERSVNLMRDKGMNVAGGYLPGEEKTWTIIETTDGIKLGVVAYVYENFEQNGRRCLNGCYIPSALESTINSFRYYNDGDMAEIKATVEACRADGADIVMAFMHWGEEYYIDPMKSQMDLAQTVVDTGVDFVVGSHPHVPEKIVWLTNKEGKEIPVYYSLGNFISNQRTETMGDTKNKVHTEEGLIANIELSYNHATGEVTFDDISAIPCWVEKYTKSGASNPGYWIIPLIDGYKDNPELKASGHMSRADQALSNIKTIVGEDYIWDGTDSGKKE